MQSRVVLVLCQNSGSAAQSGRQTDILREDVCLDQKRVMEGM
jgi:hypothetical protein